MSSWNTRYRANLVKLQTNDPALATEVVAELNEVAADEGLSFGERKMLDAAKSIVDGSYKEKFETNVIRVDFKTGRRVAA